MSTYYFDNIVKKLLDESDEVIYDPFTDLYVGSNPHLEQIAVFEAFIEPFLEGTNLDSNGKKKAMEDIILMCGRRSGKSYVVSVIMYYVLTVLKQNVGLVLPELQTFEQALWLELQDRAKEAHGLEPMIDLIYSKNNKKVYFPKRDYGYVSLYPIIKKRNALSIKGAGKGVGLFIVEEAGLYPDKLLLDIRDDAINPIKSENENLITIYLGTPPHNAKGAFIDMFMAEHHRSFRWDIFDNPFIKDPQKTIDGAVRDGNYPNQEHPTIQREYFAKVVKDTSIMVYKFNESINISDKEVNLKEDGWRLTAGFDIGYNDASVIVALAYNIYSNELRTVYEDYKEQATIPELEDMVDNLYAEYPEIPVYCDTGSGGAKNIIETFIRHGGDNRYLKPADKTKKMEDLKFLNSLFITGKFKIHPKHTGIISEVQTIRYLHDTPKTKWANVDRRAENDRTDAMLYGMRGIMGMSASKEEVEVFKETAEERDEREWIERHISGG